METRKWEPHELEEILEENYQKILKAREVEKAFFGSQDHFGFGVRPMPYDPPIPAKEYLRFMRLKRLETPSQASSPKDSPPKT